MQAKSSWCTGWLVVVGLAILFAELEFYLFQIMFVDGRMSYFTLRRKVFTLVDAARIVVSELYLVTRLLAASG